MLRLAVICLCLTITSAQARPTSSVHKGLAAQHRSLAAVAAERGMSTKGTLFASPLAPIGARLCVSSEKIPEQVCGTVVDIPLPKHRQWQLDTGRLIEVTPRLAARLCIDPTARPNMCPVTIIVLTR